LSVAVFALAAKIEAEEAVAEVEVEDVAETRP
jgi:hypothetical protein